MGVLNAEAQITVGYFGMDQCLLPNLFSLSRDEEPEAQGHAGAPAVSLSCRPLRLHDATSTSS